MPTPTPGAVGGAATDDLRTLQAAVARLGAEVAGLREAQHRRAVIEQAKGALMATRGLTADGAFEHLRTVSRQSNRRVVDVAADELARLGSGEVQPGPPAATSDRSGPPLLLTPGGRDVPGSTRPAAPAPPSTPERARRLVLLETAARGSASLRELVRSFVRLCSWPTPPDALIVQRVGAGSTLDLVCSMGFPAGFRVRWRQVPLSVDMPVGHTGRTGEPVFVEDSGEVADRWPALAYEGVHACAVLPVVVEDAVVAVLGLAWSRPTPLSGHDRRMLRAAVAAVADGVARLLPPGGVVPLLAGAGAPDDGTSVVRTALDAVAEEAVLLLPVAAERDLRLVWWNEAARTAAGAVRPGRVSEVAPHVVGSDLWACCLEVLHHRPRSLLRTPTWWWAGAGQDRSAAARAAPAAPAARDVRVSAVWNGLLVTRT